MVKPRFYHSKIQPRLGYGRKGLASHGIINLGTPRYKVTGTKVILCVGTAQTWQKSILKRMAYAWVKNLNLFILSLFHWFIISSLYPFIIFISSFHPFFLSSFHPFISTAKYTLEIFAGTKRIIVMKKNGHTNNYWRV